MGVIKQGILGAFSGKVGGVIGGSWKGIAYMRTIPANVTNPRTSAQVAQRTKMTAMVLLAQALLVGVIKPLWDRFANKMSGYNYFVQQNIAQVNAAGVITYAALRTSIGSLTGLVGLSASISSGNSDLFVTADDNTGDGTALSSDVLFYVVYYPRIDAWFVSSFAIRGDSESVAIDLGVGALSGDVFHIYGSARRADGTLVSNSTYLLKTVA